MNLFPPIVVCLIVVIMLGKTVFAHAEKYVGVGYGTRSWEI